MKQLLIDKRPDLVYHIDKFNWLVNKLYITKFIDKRYSSSTTNQIKFGNNMNISSSITHSYDFNSDCSKPVRFEVIRDMYEYKNLEHLEKKEIKRHFIPLHFDNLSTVLTTNLTKDILSTLLDLNIIETDNQYTVGEKSKSYRLMPLYHDETFKKVPIEDVRFRNKLLKLKDRAVANLNDVHRQIYYNMFHFRFDMPQAEKIMHEMNLDADEQLSIQLSIDKIIDRDFFFATDPKTGRIFHNYCNLKREFRTCLRDEDNLSLTEIDVANSQPFLLGVIMTERNVCGEDVLKYQRLCKDAQIYDYIAQQCNWKRDFVKKQMLTLFFCKNHWQFKLKQMFVNEFPTVYSFIEEIKKDDNRDLAILLQKEEASIMIDTISEKLLEQNVQFITVHDSLMISQKDASLVMNQMKKSFQERYNEMPIFKEK